MRAGSRLFDSGYYVVNVQMSPSQRIGDVSLDVTFGDDVDFANERPARGATIGLQGTVRPTDHLALQLNGDRRWLDVSPTGAGRGTRACSPPTWPASRRPTPSPPAPSCG